MMSRPGVRYSLLKELASFGHNPNVCPIISICPALPPPTPLSFISGGRRFSSFPPTAKEAAEAVQVEWVKEEKLLRRAVTDAQKAHRDTPKSDPQPYTP